MADVRDPLEHALRGRYTIDRELRRGGMATVYLAQDVRHGRRVAIKVLHPELAAVIGDERFLAEITTTANRFSIAPVADSVAQTPIRGSAPRSNCSAVRTSAAHVPRTTTCRPTGSGSS